MGGTRGVDEANGGRLKPQQRWRRHSAGRQTRSGNSGCVRSARKRESTVRQRESRTLPVDSPPSCALSCLLPAAAPGSPPCVCPFLSSFLPRRPFCFRLHTRVGFCTAHSAAAAGGGRSRAGCRVSARVATLRQLRRRAATRRADFPASELRAWILTSGGELRCCNGLPAATSNFAHHA